MLMVCGIHLLHFFFVAWQCYLSRITNERFQGGRALVSIEKDQVVWYLRIPDPQFATRFSLLFLAHSHFKIHIFSILVSGCLCRVVMPYKVPILLAIASTCHPGIFCCLSLANISWTVSCLNAVAEYVPPIVFLQV